MQMQAAILAGGQGTRMRPVTREPKALLPLGGRPLLAHQLDWLAALGFKDVFLCLGYGAERIKEVFGDGSAYGIKLRYSIEKEPRGTAGAAADLKPEQDLLVLYGDLAVSFDGRGLIAAHEGKKAAATLLLRPTDHPEDSDLAELDGGGSIRWLGRLSGAPEPKGERLGCCAVWIVSARLLKRVPADRPSDFVKDLFRQALADGLPLCGHRIDGGVNDIGTPARYERFAKSFEARS